MRLISWNVNGRVDDALRKQATAVLERDADVIALQELTLESYSQWCDALLPEGFSIVSTIDLVQVPYPAADPPIRRKYFNAIAARGAIAALPGLSYPDPSQAAVAFPEKYVAARIVLGELALEVHNAHLPPGSTRGKIKPQMFSAIRWRTDAVTAPIVLCGDFNTPQREDEAGVTTWASSHRDVPGWDAAERAVLENPRLRDVYRERRESGSPFPASHYTGTTARRYDHIYASADVHATACYYHAGWLIDKDRRLSDHAPVEADLELSAHERSD